MSTFMSYVTRVVEGERRIEEIRRAIKEIYAEAQKAGYDKRALELAIVQHRHSAGHVERHGSRVYFLRFPEKSLVKIGVTKSLDDRVRTLAGAANKRNLVGTIDGDGVTERVIHYQFRHSREYGEYFAWTPISEQVRGMIARNSGLLREHLQ